MHLSRFAALIVAATLALFPVLGTLAQNDTPTTVPVPPIGKGKSEPGTRLDLAAIALDSTDIGADYTLSFEAYYAPGQLSQVLFNGEIPSSTVEATGIRWYYESSYTTSDGVTTVRSYVEEYGTVAQVTKGFNLFENEDRFAPAGATATDEPGLGIGDDPSELTTIKVVGSRQTQASTTLDATFRVDRMLMGVAIDTTATTPPDQDQLTELATRLQERAQAVVDGEDLPDVDPSLPNRLLGFADSFDLDEGYKSLVEAYGGGTPAEVSSSYKSNYTRMVYLGQDVKALATTPLPLINISTTAFDGETAGLTILSNSLLITPYGSATLVGTDPIPGTAASQAITFADPFNNKDVNSARVIVLIGTDLLFIDVLGAKTSNIALETALSLAKQEAGCYSDDAGCGVAQLPADFGNAQG